MGLADEPRFESGERPLLHSARGYATGPAVRGRCGRRITLTSRRAFWRIGGIGPQRRGGCAAHTGGLAPYSGGREEDGREKAEEAEVGERSYPPTARPTFGGLCGGDRQSGE